MMHQRFRDVIEELHPAFERLMDMKPLSGGPPHDKANGVYLFSERDHHIYVGRAKNIANRYKWHCDPLSDHNKANLAFKFARKATGNVKASYKKGSQSRRGLIQNPEFSEAFKQAKKRIRAMDFRYVHVPDPTQQALLETYVSIVLQTPYNDFRTS